MTQLNLGTSSISAGAKAQEEKRPPSRVKKIAIALLLGLLVPGLGQIFARRPRRGIAMAASVTLLSFVISVSRVLLSFWGFVIAFPVSVIWRLWIAGDGSYVACKELVSPSPRGSVKLMIAATLVVLLLGVYPVPDYILHRSLRYFGAFRMNSGSMCPTLCEGDRVVAARDAFKLRSPERGELLLFDFHHTGSIYTKRVIGVPGDTIARGPANTILVNNKALAFPKSCGRNESFSPLAAEGLPFQTVTVPKDALFVIGDNLDNSFDSRSFGFVTMDEVRAKPLFIYLSPNHSRIGCELH
ncbi:MAG TPA: signal peptidase I [Candidatus Solibacter sp.]|nr:signal peptidase I [Candidatus Solibacter sp.]